MSEIGTGLIARIQVRTSKEGVDVSALDFSADFHVHGNRRLCFSSADMPRSGDGDGRAWYAMIDTLKLGCGLLMATVRVNDPVSHWEGGVRPVVQTLFTGRFISSGGPVRTRPAPEPEYRDGYLVDIQFVDSIPGDAAAEPPGEEDSYYDEGTETLYHDCNGMTVSEN